MAIKKSALYGAIWASCDELRGGMDASQYKDYVLVILFLKYISDKQKSDPDSLLNEIPEGCTFDDIVQFKGKPGIGEALNTRLELIAKAFGLGDGFFNSADFDNEDKLGKGKDLIDTVSNLIGVFQNPALDFGNNRAADDDLIGDAYEYLMRNFASQSGKSKGQFYTPAEASRLAAKLLDIAEDKRPKITIYDMAAGSGSLLLRAAAESNASSTFLYGQEKDLATRNMAKMNMILHGMDGFEDIQLGDTLNNPIHLASGQHDDGFDYCVANPPFSIKKWLKSAKEKDVYGRWDETDERVGMPPKGVADFAFFMHLIRSLAPDGKGACFLPHGVLFRGGAEAIVRKNLINRHIIRGIIGLPSNLFYGTPIAACIIVVDKTAAKTSKGIFMIDAKDGFRKDGPKNRLREQDIRRILDTWHEGKTVPHYARLVEWSEIERNQYNLNISRYITPRDTEPNQDLYAHLHGGIPQSDVDEMATLWQACPSLKSEIFAESAMPGYLQLTERAQDNLEKVVGDNASFAEQHDLFHDAANRWYGFMQEELENVAPGCKPKSLIVDWGTKTLEIFNQRRMLVDAYDVYDALMVYWDETMQDDVYMVSRDGWKVTVELPRDKKGNFKKKYTYENVTCDLLPPDILVASCFSEEKQKIDRLQEQIAAHDAALDEMVEEFGSLFEEAVNDKDKVVDKTVRALLKLSKKNKDDYTKEEIAAWTDYVKLLDEKDELKDELKEAVDALTEAVMSKYATITEDEVRDIVFREKWMGQMGVRLSNLFNAAHQQIVSSIEELTERYADTLPELESDTDAYRKAVAEDLTSMGFSLQED